jgi:hypothetical protein
MVLCGPIVHREIIEDSDEACVYSPLRNAMYVLVFIYRELLWHFRWGSHGIGQTFLKYFIEMCNLLTLKINVFYFFLWPFL